MKRIPLLTLVCVSCILALTSCSRKQEEQGASASTGSGKPATGAMEAEKQAAEAFAKSVCAAVFQGDEKGFANLHLKKGDTTPDGASGYCTKRGGGLPDQAWDDLVRSKYQEARAWIEQNGGKFEYFALANAEIPASRNDWEQKNVIVYSIDAAIRAADGREFALRMGESVMTQRGRVLLENPGLTFIPASEYQHPAAR